MTTNPVNYNKAAPDVFGALEKVHNAIDAHGLDRTLHHLVQLRASQINACAYCVKMHTKEAREDGETNERLDRLVVWNQVCDFSPRERAALAWTEALTQLDRVLFEHAIERVDAFEQHGQVGRCAPIQLLMSAITASLPMSLSGSWK